jgi:hypothetical protein
MILAERVTLEVFDDDGPESRARKILEDIFARGPLWDISCHMGGFQRLFFYSLKLKKTAVAEWLSENPQVEAPEEFMRWLRQGDTSPPQQTAVAPASDEAKNEVTQKEAARELEVTERTIRNWETEKTTSPPGYPGRRSRTNFLVFAADFKTSKSLKRNARAKNRAVPGGDMSEESGANGL